MFFLKGSGGVVLVPTAVGGIRDYQPPQPTEQGLSLGDIGYVAWCDPQADQLTSLVADRMRLEAKEPVAVAVLALSGPLPHHLGSASLMGDWVNGGSKA
jgi:hypothetical protein